MPSQLHQARLDTILQHLLASGAQSVLDLGCGPGELLRILAPYTEFQRIIGIDIDPQAISRAREILGIGLPHPADRIQLRCASFEEADPAFREIDAAVLLETLEHIKPSRLSLVERAVFQHSRPRIVLITTPNQEYNVLHGMEPGQRRHPGHHFEWDREKFRRWANSLALRHGYRAVFFDIGPLDRLRGSSTQMARFDRTD